MKKVSLFLIAFLVVISAGIQDAAYNHLAPGSSFSRSWLQTPRVLKYLNQLGAGETLSHSDPNQRLASLRWLNLLTKENLTLQEIEAVFILAAPLLIDSNETVKIMTNQIVGDLLERVSGERRSFLLRRLGNKKSLSNRTFLTASPDPIIRAARILIVVKIIESWPEYRLEGLALISRLLSDQDDFVHVSARIALGDKIDIIKRMKTHVLPGMKTEVEGMKNALLLVQSL